MPRNLDLPTQHRLKKDIQARGITLWMLREALGGKPSEFKLCRMLNGIESMAPDIEYKIRKYLFDTDEL